MNNKVTNSPTPKPTDSWNNSLSWRRAWPALLSGTISSAVFITLNLFDIPNFVVTLSIVLGMQLPILYLRRLKYRRAESSLWLFWSGFTTSLLFIITSLIFIAYKDGLF